jgi:hypothetical protein
MKFLMMHKHDKTTESGKMPSGEFIAEMGAMVGGLLKEGVMKDGAGLGKTVNRSRVSVHGGGAPAVQHGPYRGGDNGKDELADTITMVTVKSRDEAVAWAEKAARVLGDAEFEVGKTTEASDLGLAPFDPNAPLHYLLIQKATRDSEAGKRPSGKVKADLDNLHKEMRAQGVLTNHVTLAPSKQAKRIQLSPGKQKTIDGPFAESKELIGGFCLVELPSWQAAIDLATKYGALMLKSVDDLELDLRPLEE